MKILLFIVLKIVEIGGLIFIPYWTGKFMEKYVFNDRLNDNKFTSYLYGWASLLIMIPLIGVIIVLIVEFFKMNWNIVNQIIR